MLTITVSAQSGEMRKTLDEAMAALGYIRQAERAILGEALSGTSLSSHDVVHGMNVHTGEEYIIEPDGSKTIVSDKGAEASAAAQPARERGKPSPGRQRRTKEEVAEDTAADAADAARVGERPQIQASPENRVGPQDSAEVQAQDAADEKAESDATRGADLTLDDVRDAVGRYYDKFGMAASQGDIRAMFGVPLHEIPETQEAYASAIKAVDDAIVNNPFSRTPVAGAAPAKPAVTLDNLKAVMGRYIQRFGETEGYADLPKVLGVTTINDLPNDPVVYAAKIADVETALANNPFGRRVLT